jgi:RNA polymerase sigma-70 factor (ECF subfamily)
MACAVAPLSGRSGSTVPLTNGKSFFTYISLIAQMALDTLRNMVDQEGGALRERLERAVAGDADSWRQILSRHHDRLLRVVSLRLHFRVRRRLDPADVLQEVYLEVLSRLPRYLKDPRRPFHRWLCLLAGERLGKLHRRHLGARMRTAGREVRPGLAERPVGVVGGPALGDSQPGEVAGRADQRKRLRELLGRLAPQDREVLSLRHFEQLSAAQTASVLGLTEAAAAKRYLRALERLRCLLADSPGGLDIWRP